MQEEETEDLAQDKDDGNDDVTQEIADDRCSAELEEDCVPSTVSVLSHRIQTRPRAQFLPGHLESMTHFLKVIAPH